MQVQKSGFWVIDDKYPCPDATITTEAEMNK
jgi:hypothetical protein